ncbi:MAG TPA: glycosyltransferase family protein [Methanoregula sp.]|nr:glycosyltransferase family protein [Methanoregula sp.]
MRILFVVCGEGLGHTSRCLHLGHYLQAHGHEVHFAGYGKSYDFMDQHLCPNLHHTHREVCLEGEGGFFSLKKTLWHSKWVLSDMCRSVLDVCGLIKKGGFDVVVCDTMYGGVLAARIKRVPVVFITNQNHFSGPHGEMNAVWSTLNFLVARYLRLASHIIVPDFPPPDTISEYNIVIPKGEENRYSFTGPLFDLDNSRYTFMKKTIFTSFGGEPFKLPMYEMFRSIADCRKDLFFDVFYTGPTLPESSDNFASHGYVPNLFEHLAEAKAAIVHGGLTTLHEALLFEKPVLVIVDPNHPEQQNNARKIVDMGAGIAVDGRTISCALLEGKLAETMALSQKPFYSRYGSLNGRQKAMEIIARIAGRKRN